MSARRTVGVVVVLAIAGVLVVSWVGGHGSTRAAPLRSPTTTPAPPTGTTSPTPQPSTSLEIGNAGGVGAQQPPGSLAAAQASQLASRPAYQHLPYAGDGIVANVVGRQDTQVVVDVVSSDDQAAATAAWQAFLARWDDPGGAYVVHYVTGVGADR